MGVRNERRDGGFTLGELLVVVAIMSILAGVVVFATGGLTDQASTASCQADARQLTGAEERHRAVHGGYATEADLVARDLLRGESEHYDVVLTDGSYVVTPTGDCDDLAASAPASAVPAGAFGGTASPMRYAGADYVDPPEAGMGSGSGSLYFVFVAEDEEGDAGTTFVAADDTVVPGVPGPDGPQTFHAVLGRMLGEGGGSSSHFTGYMDETWFALAEFFTGQSLSRDCDGFTDFFALMNAESEDAPTILCDNFAPSILTPNGPDAPYTFAGTGAFLQGPVSVVEGFSPPALTPGSA